LGFNRGGWQAGTDYENETFYVRRAMTKDPKLISEPPTLIVFVLCIIVLASKKRLCS